VKLKEARSKLPTVRTEIGSEAGCGRQAGWEQRSPKVIKTHQVEPGGTGGQILYLTWGDLACESAEEVIRGRSSEEATVTVGERRAEEPKNGAREGTGHRRNNQDSNCGRNNCGCQPGSANRQRRCSRGEPRAERPCWNSRTFRQKAVYENLMDAMVADENRARALEAVKRNRGSAGIDGMKTTELETHLQAHWERIRAKLLAGTYIPSPVRRVEIPKPSGGTRMLGIPTVQDQACPN